MIVLLYCRILLYQKETYMNATLW